MQQMSEQMCKLRTGSTAGVRHRSWRPAQLNGGTTSLSPRPQEPPAGPSEEEQRLPAEAEQLQQAVQVATDKPQSCLAYRGHAREDGAEGAGAALIQLSAETGAIGAEHITALDQNQRAGQEQRHLEEEEDISGWRRTGWRRTRRK